MRFFRHYALSAFLITISFFAFSQEKATVSWKTTAEKIAEGSYKVKFTGTVKKGWHVYTLPDKESELSGLTTSSDDSAVVPRDLTLLTPGSNILDPVFSKTLAIVRDSLVFTQTILVSGPVPSAIGLQVNYEVADKESFFPESVNLRISTGALGAKVPTNRILISSIE